MPKVGPASGKMSFDDAKMWSGPGRLGRAALSSCGELRPSACSSWKYMTESSRWLPVMLSTASFPDGWQSKFEILIQLSCSATTLATFYVTSPISSSTCNSTSVSELLVPDRSQVWWQQFSIPLTPMSFIKSLSNELHFRCPLCSCHLFQSHLIRGHRQLRGHDSDLLKSR